VLEVQTAAAAAAAAAAASFPSDLITETLKYIIAASGNRQIAAQLSALSSLNSPAC